MDTSASVNRFSLVTEVLDDLLILILVDDDKDSCISRSENLLMSYILQSERWKHRLCNSSYTRLAYWYATYNPLCVFNSWSLSTPIFRIADSPTFPDYKFAHIHYASITFYFENLTTYSHGWYRTRKWFSICSAQARGVKSSWDDSAVPGPRVEGSPLYTWYARLLRRNPRGWVRCK